MNELTNTNSRQVAKWIENNAIGTVWHYSKPGKKREKPDIESGEKCSNFLIEKQGINWLFLKIVKIVVSVKNELSWIQRIDHIFSLIKPDSNLEIKSEFTWNKEVFLKENFWNYESTPSVM